MSPSQLALLLYVYTVKHTHIDYDVSDMSCLLLHRLVQQTHRMERYECTHRGSQIVGSMLALLNSVL